LLGIIRRFDRILYLVVSTLVVVLLLLMVGLSFVQVILRNFANYGIPWAEVILRHMVIAVGMFGAVIAARQGRQISIDVLSRIVTPKIKIGLRWLTTIFTIVVCIALVKASWYFVSSEKEFGSELFSGIPAWIFQIVIPIGFGLIALQSLLNLILGRGHTDLPEITEVKDEKGESE
jgi:C4-dicarboxylate transporter, DctQ subunit